MKHIIRFLIESERYFHAVDLHFANKRLDLPAMRTARLGMADCDRRLDLLSVQP